MPWQAAMRSFACAQDDRRGNAIAAKVPDLHLRFLEVLLVTPTNVCFDIPCQRDPPMSKSLAFATASHSARHAAASPCDVPRGIAVGRELSAILLSHPTGPLLCRPAKVTTGNAGNTDNLIFLRIDPPHPQKGSGKWGNPLRCRFYRCFCSAVAGCLPLAEPSVTGLGESIP
jgi:hypothetical protein